MRSRYTLENFKKLWGQPEFVFWELQRLAFDFKYKTEAVDVMSRDWDNLLLLDACRYDYFRCQNTISGELNPVISHGGQSWEFMRGNFVDKQFHDTIYVTANPHTGKLANDLFYTVEQLHLNEWNDEQETVLPQSVVEAATRIYQQYPDKRLIVHFMQPHRPYLGDTAKRLQRKHDVTGFNRHLAYGDEGPDTASFATLIERGEISIQKAKKAYSETLDIVLESVNELLKLLSGKSVVSADHGELLGEKIVPFTTPKFGHSHKYIRNEILYKVPWLETPFEERREVTSDKPIGFANGEPEMIEDRLRALGYR